MNAPLFKNLGIYNILFLVPTTLCQGNQERDNNAVIKKYLERMIPSCLANSTEGNL